jgi:hypothetical protein
MGILELKNKVHQQIDNSDETILIQVFNLLEHHASKTIAYDAAGNSLTIQQYNEEIDKGIKDIKDGKFLSQEALENEIENWK